jgi:hypothetical protein
VIAGLLTGQAGGHEPDHRDLDEVFGVGGDAFVIPAQPAAAGKRVTALIALTALTTLTNGGHRGNTG